MGVRSTKPRVNLLADYAFASTMPYTAEDFSRQDEAIDTSFYSQPRFVTHIDDAAISALTDFYAEKFTSDASMLDICSSWISHYPSMSFKSVVHNSSIRILLILWFRSE